MVKLVMVKKKGIKKKGMLRRMKLLCNISVGQDAVVCRRQFPVRMCLLKNGCCCEMCCCFEMCCL